MSAPASVQGPQSLGGCFVRMGWLVMAPTALFVCAAVILVNRIPVGSVVDLLYVGFAAAALWLRRLEARQAAADSAQVPGGDAATFTRTFVPAAVGGLVLAHVLKAVIA